MKFARFGTFNGASLMAPACAMPHVAHAQVTESAVPSENDRLESSRGIVVQGNIGYRNRTDDPEPVLVYAASTGRAGPSIRRQRCPGFMNSIPAAGLGLRRMPAGCR